MLKNNVKENKFDQFLMPPPVRNTIYRTHGKTQNRIHMLSNGEKATSTVLNSSAQFSLPNILSVKSTSSYISANTNISKDDPQSYIVSNISTNDVQKVVRMFSRWKVMLNNQYELIIKGTLECGKIAHSKPILRRHTATCIESKFKYKYHLQGNIVDETNELPDYIYGKFYNGFPDDWENVYEIWRTYINQGCPITFRWPTSITDSDDDLKSEMTDLTYIHMRNDKAKSYRLAENIQFKYSNNKSPKKEKKCDCSTYSSQSYKKNTSFARSFIPESENNTAQTRNVSLAYDENNEQDLRSNVNTLCSLRKMTIKDYIQEDKLNIIINNLADKNCSQTYIYKIVEMFDCLNYVASYEMPSECSHNLMVLARQDASKSEQIPPQQIVMHNNCVDSNKNTGNRTTELKSCVHSSDLENESIKNDFITTRQSNPVNIEHNEDSDKSESEIYAGIPKISIERVLRHGERMYKRQTRKKIIPQRYAVNPWHSVRESAQTTIPIVNVNETSRTESRTRMLDEATNMERIHRKATVVHQRSPEKFIINQQVQRNNINIHEKDKPAMQNQQFFAQNLNAFVKDKRNVSHGIPQQQEVQVVSNIDSDIDVIDTQKPSGSTTPHIYLDEDIVIGSKSNSNFPEKSHIREPRELHREFIERSENEIATKRSKPIITSSIPVNLNLKINNTDLKLARSHDSDVTIEENEQCAINRSTEEVDAKKSMLSVKSAIIANDFHSGMTADNKKEVHPNKKSMMNPATEQFNGDELKPKILTAWMPEVVYYAKFKCKLGLIFQGKLLNEAGYVANRNFRTNIVVKRLSKTLVETVNHEFFELRGHLNNKHNIPKKLARQCRDGCPANIEQFCLTWETLQNSNLHIASVDLSKASVNSRGRKIVPSLCYWEGEHVSLKDDNLVYNPDSSQESSFASLKENSNKTLNTEETKQQEVDFNNASKMQSMNKQKLFESNEDSINRKQIKTANTTKKSMVKRRIAQRLTFSSTDSEKEVSPRKRLCNSQSKVYADAESLNSRLRRRTSSFYPSLQNRASHEGTTKPNNTAYCSLTKKAGSNVTYAYYKDVPVSEDFLSEDQISILGDNRRKISALH